jgi:hypothetical protein
MLKLLALPMLAAGSLSGQGGSGASAPIYVASEAVPGGMRFQVVAAPQGRFQGSFALEVASGGNQSRHQGTANLNAGERAVLSTVTIGASEQTPWRAHLRVEPVGAAAYEQVLASNR